MQKELHSSLVSFLLVLPTWKYGWTARLIQVTICFNGFVALQLHSTMQVGFKRKQSGTSPFSILARVATYHTLIVAVNDSRWFTRWFINGLSLATWMSEANAQMWSSCSSWSLNHNFTAINFSLTVWPMLKTSLDPSLSC